MPQLRLLFNALPNPRDRLLVALLSGCGLRVSEACRVRWGDLDRGILRAWSYRLLPSFARTLFGGSVILGGRRPARALEHFRNEAGARAICGSR